MRGGGHGGLWHAGLPVLMVAALAAGSAVAGAGPDAAGGPRVRVRLAEQSAPVRIALANGASHRLEVGRHGLRVDGRRVGRVVHWAGPGPVRVDGRAYRGGLVVSRVDGRRLCVVNEVPLEDYVAGTLLEEVYANWEPAVLEAQAVAIRSYVLRRVERAHEHGEAWDVEADESSAVYGGVEAESPKAWAAVRATRGQYLSWHGEPILAAFHASSGGRTASAAEVWGRAIPYLVSIPVPGEEDSPDMYWRVSVSAATLARALANQGHPVGRVRAATVTGRTPSGRARTVRIDGTHGSVELTGRALRTALGPNVLRSTLFEIRPAHDGFVFVGSGRGHGVGMSQWGARALARRGEGYRAILARFYPGTHLRHLPEAAARRVAEGAPADEGER